MLKDFGNFVNCAQCQKRLSKSDAREYRYPTTNKNDIATVIILCQDHYLERCGNDTAQKAEKLNTALKGN